MLAVILSLVGLYAVLQFSGGLHSWEDIARIDPTMLGIACGLVVTGWVLDARRMQILTHSLGGHLGILNGMRISIVGNFVSGVTPFDSGGEPVQVYLLTEKNLNAGQATAIVAVKTLCNAWARFSLGLAASLWLFFLSDFWTIPRPMYFALMFGIIMYFLVFTCGLYLVFHPDKISVIVVPAVRNRLTLRFFKPEVIDAVLKRIESELREFTGALQEFMDNRRSVLWQVVGLSYLWWLMFTMVPAVILVGLGMPPQFVRVMGITLIFYLAAAYAPTPGSSGAAELGFSLLFSSIVPNSLIGLFVTVWRGFTYYLNLLVGGLLMSAGLMRKKSGSVTDESSHLES